jgi:hypothetical protein
MFHAPFREACVDLGAIQPFRSEGIVKQVRRCGKPVLRVNPKPLARHRGKNNLSTVNG